MASCCLLTALRSQVLAGACVRPLHVVRRGIISTALEPTDGAWERRLTEPMMKKLNLANYYHDIDKQARQWGRISAVDVDLFVNKVSKAEELDEAQDLLYKLRMSPSTIKMLPSTSHAFVRACIKYDEIPLLMRVLDDRVNYGVFLDDASSVLLLQHLIQRENFGDAARASTFLMLQEELDLNPMATTLSLLACHLAVRRGSAVEADEGAKPGLFWEYEEPPAEEEDEENVEYRKIKFMSIPYFDDHFDLRQPRHLVGKTLVEVCPVIPDLPVGDDSTKATLVASSKLLGFALWEKKDLLLKAVEDAKTTPVHPDIQQVLGQYIEGIEDDLKELKVDPSLPNPEEMCLSLHKEMEALHGEKVVQEIGELYDEFVARRKREVARELEATKLRSRMEKVKETKEELLDKERLLFFFEKEEELEFELEARIPKYAVGPSKRQQYFRARLYRRSLIREGKPVPKYLKPYQSGEY